MVLKFVRGGFKQFLFFCLFLFSCGVSTVVHAIERAPFIKAPLAVPYYTANPQSACEYYIDDRRGTPWFPVPGPGDADLLSISAIPSNQNGSPITSGPASSYRCAAKILRLGIIMDIYAGWTYPACNVGGSSAGITSETVCHIPDTTIDTGANLGRESKCIQEGNPIHSATSNKVAKQDDIALKIDTPFLTFI